MLVQCGECGREVSDRAVACPACGNPAAREGRSGMPFVWKLALVVGVLFAFGFLLGIAGNNALNSPKRRDELAIEKCRETERDALLDLGARRFARAACDRMVDEFRSRYGAEPR
uniref:Zinc-ribbon domain-containing protein n=1 Tax=Ralstonia solanacearum TaxID=305 RepID=A0A0S4VMT0_RALSL|nr:conserved protein of unknown function [Ralstonia solanacearum]CUV35873.1 conserved protein of unknown function [Ralstonia solanacearum]